MNVDLLIALIHEYGLSPYQSEILRSVKPAVFLNLEPLRQGEMGKAEIGQSRLGGVPDLPISMGWPRSARGDYYLCFILQINCAQLPHFPESPFPQRGMLYLFEGGGDDSSDQILLWKGTELLQPATAPSSEKMTSDWYEEVVPHALSFALGPDIPRWATDDFYELCNGLEIDEGLLDDVGRALSKKCVGKLLGHAAGIGHDPRQDAYVVREVDAKLLYNYENRKTVDMTPARRWQNLLTVDSNRAADLWFGDAGYLQVLIREDDLSRMDLSRAYVVLESS